jgi:hypothetical protein
MSTKSGRNLSRPIPLIRPNSKFKEYDILKLKQWLLRETVEEAICTDDNESAYYFVNIDYKNITTEEFNLATEYLFGTGTPILSIEPRTLH